MYTAILISTESKNKLISSLDKKMLEKIGFTFKTPIYKLPHHATINMKELDVNLNSPNILGKKAIMSISEFCHNFRVGAFIVDQAQIENNEKINFYPEIPHITACLMPGVKPYESNIMLKERNLIRQQLHLTINGVVVEIS